MLNIFFFNQLNKIVDSTNKLIESLCSYEIPFCHLTWNDYVINFFNGECLYKQLASLSLFERSKL